MNKLIIVTDTGADMQKTFIEENQIPVIPIVFVIDGKEYDPRDHTDDDKKTFYDKLRNGTRITTAAPGEGVCKPIFEEILKAGDDLLYIGFSSGLSSTYSTGAIVLENLRQVYKDQKIVHIDGLAGTLGQGRLVMEAVRMRNEGKTIEEIEEKVKIMVKTNKHLFTVESLKYLFRGGRLSRTSALLGTVLQIKPILDLDVNGKIRAVGKIIGRGRSLNEIAKRTAEMIKNPEEQTVYLCHGDCLEDAKLVAKKIETLIKVKGFEFSYLNITLGAHVGAGAIAVFFDGKDENK